MKETVQTAAEEHIPRKKRRKQPWITQETFDLAEDRKRAKMIGDKNKWSRLNKTFSHSVKEDKRNYIEKKCDEMERGRDDSKIAFGIVKELTKKWIPRMDVIDDEDGNI